MPSFAKWSNVEPVKRPTIGGMIAGHYKGLSWWHWAFAIIVVGAVAAVGPGGFTHGTPSVLRVFGWLLLFDVALSLGRIGKLTGAPRDVIALKRAKTEGKWHLVKMTLSTAKGKLGTDDGIVSIQGGALVYEGLRTSFRMGGGDAFVPDDAWAEKPLMQEDGKKWNYGNKAHQSAWGFDLREKPEVHVFFFPLSAGPSSLFLPSQDRPGKEFYREVFDWLQGGGHVEEVVLPPIEPMN